MTARWRSLRRLADRGGAEGRLAPPPGLWVPRALFALAGLLMVTPIIGAAQLVAARQTKLAVIRDREAELSRLSWRLEFALAASEVGVWDVDLATDELLWDERTKALFGFAGRPGPFGEADWAGALHPEDRERAMAEANAAVTGNGRFVTDYRIVLPDGGSGTCATWRRATRARTGSGWSGWSGT